MRPYQSPDETCPTPIVPSRQVVDSVIDYQIIRIAQSAGALADFPVQLKRPYNTLIFASTDSNANPIMFITFVLTGQSSINNGSGTFNARAAAFATPFRLTQGQAVCFNVPVQQFFVSIIEPSTNPDVYFILATNDIDIDNTSVL